MPNYPGRRKLTRRVVISHQGKQLEWIVEGTKADGDAFEARKRLELKALGEQKRTAPKFSELCELYALHAESHLKESTWKRVRIYQVATLVEHFGKLKVDSIGVENIDAFKRTRLAQRMRGKPIGPTAVNNELRVLSAIFTWGRESGYPIPPLKWKKLKRRGNDRVKFWSRDELDRIFESTRKLYPDLLPMVVFLINTGCRKGEALAAQWSWVDFEAGVITIPASDVWQPKSGRSRDVPLADAVRAVLSGQPRHATMLFPTSRGNRPYEDFPRESFCEILSDAGVTGYPHMFRHTFASEFLAETRDLHLLSEILGHSTTRVTEIYAHLLPGKLDRAKNAVNLSPRTLAITLADRKKVTK
jgi:integrase